MSPTHLTWSRAIPVGLLPVLLSGFSDASRSAEPANPPTAGVPAFPGAEGFGATTVGGRGGRILEVTNLHDAGPGSFRAAVEAKAPRIVVFRVAGTIELATEVVLSNPYITIAGQTAPGDGICLKTALANTRSAMTINGAHDVVIRYLRIRPGPHQGFPRLKNNREPDTSEVKDALQILSARRVVVDHCSLSWATDEVVSTFYDAQDVTIQWCIIAEAMRKSRPDQALPGKGLLIGSKGCRNVSVHHNLMAQNVGRNPLIKASGLVDVVNNVAWVPDKVAMAVSPELGLSPVNVVGNYVAAPGGEGLVYGILTIGQGPHSLYVRDNLGPYRSRADQPQDLFVQPTNDGRRWITDRRHDAPPVTTFPVAEVLERVLTGAGCTLPVRDAVDRRIVDDVRAGRIRLVDDPNDVGGWPALASAPAPQDTDHDGMPDAWEIRHRLIAADPSDGSADADADGYTNVEEFLNDTDPRAGS